MLCMLFSLSMCVCSMYVYVKVTRVGSFPDVRHAVEDRMS